jgi:transcriptional regulator with XRE-family HTH domain
MIRAQGVPVVEIDLDALRQELGRRIAARRVGLGMAQLELAHRIGMTFQQVQKYERGRNSMSVTGMLAICAALDWSPQELLDGLRPPALSATVRYSASRRRCRVRSSVVGAEREGAAEHETAGAMARH